MTTLRFQVELTGVFCFSGSALQKPVAFHHDAVDFETSVVLLFLQLLPLTVVRPCALQRVAAAAVLFVAAASRPGSDGV